MKVKVAVIRVSMPVEDDEAGQEEHKDEAMELRDGLIRLADWGVLDPWLDEGATVAWDWYLLDEPEDE